LLICNDACQKAGFGHAESEWRRRPLGALPVRDTMNCADRTLF
jgi:hypothetical protein